MNEPSKQPDEPQAASVDAVVIPRQCKDIPDRPILEFLLSHKGKWCNWYFGNELDVHLAMPKNTPDKLVLAKMRMLMRKGFVSGCGCGCRGDFEITDKGVAFWSQRRDNVSDDRAPTRKV
jgi:hypothetical protein